MEKEDILIVGCSLTADVKGGMQAGIDTCWYNPLGANPGGGVQPTYMIPSFSELPGLLGEL